MLHEGGDERGFAEQRRGRCVWRPLSRHTRHLFPQGGETSLRKNGKPAICRCQTPTGNRLNSNGTPLEGIVVPQWERAAAELCLARSLVKCGQRLYCGQADAAFLAAARENLTAATGRHAGAESKFADPLDFRWLPKLLHDVLAPRGELKSELL